MPAISVTSAQAESWLHQSGVSLGASQRTYSVPTATSRWSDYAAGQEPSLAGYAPPSAALAAGFRTAMTSWDELIAAAFTEVADNASGAGEVRVAVTSYSDSSYAYAYQSTPRAPGSKAGDIWVRSEHAGDPFTTGTYSYLALMHEIGHTLGLKHTFDAPTTPAAYDSYRYTIMSYTDAGLAVRFAEEGGGLRSYIETAVATTPMVLDVMAVQRIYGADTTTRTGDNTYSFIQGAPTYQTIWDAGGNDTFDASSFTRRVIIDLRAGSYSSLGQQSAAEQIGYWSALFPQYRNFITQTINGTANLYTYTDNVGVAFGAVIENAIGGAAADSITGNEANNILNGGGGADTLIGLTGNDVYAVDNMGDVLVEARGEGTADTVYAQASYTLTADAEIENFAAATAISAVGLALTGNQFGQAIAGTYGNDTITGAGSSVNGGDILIGLRGDDLYVVDAPNILLIEATGEGNDSATILASASGFILNGDGEVETLVAQTGTAAITITGNMLAQRIVGNAGNNLLSTGGGGADTLDGGLGDDTYRVHGTVVIADAGGNDVLYTSGSFRLTAGAGIETISTAVQAGTETIDIAGNELGQLIVGNFGTNLLDGREGNDTLIGLQGADTFAFTTPLGASNVDTIQDFVSGTDRIGLASDVFAAVTSGGIATNEFVIGTAATSADSRLIYDQPTGRLFYDADANGAGAPVLFAQLAANTGLSAADFIAIAPTV